MVEAAEEMPVPKLSRLALRAFIAAQHRRGVHGRPIEIEIVPRHYAVKCKKASGRQPKKNETAAAP